ncbi:MAG: hypothetical protein H6735_31045 [Alphaproteobacteria bacterium]|nr:hypothetical protein [Alphaproteobacteria bacterium]
MLRHLIPVTVLLAAGCNDIELRQLENEPPTAEIFTHRDQDVVLEGYAERFGGTVSDDRSTPICNWYVDEQQICTSEPDENGDCWCDWVPPLTDGVRVRLEAVDDEGEKTSVLVDLAVQATDPPEIVVVTPVSTRTYYDNTPVPLTGVATDNEDDEPDLEVTWTSDADGALNGATTNPDARGAFASEALLSRGRHVLTATVVDTSGKSASTSVTIDVGGPNTPPTCEITFPSDGGELAEFHEVVFAGLADDVNVPPTELVVTFEDDVAGVLGMTNPTIDGDVLFPYTGLALGPHTITMTAVDDAGASCSDTVSVTVVEPPSAPVVHIEPQTPAVNEDLTCVIDAPSIDPQGDPVSYRFEWTYDGVPFTAATQTIHPGDTALSVFTGSGQVWECFGYGTDGKTESSPGTDSVTIGIPSVDRVYVNTDHACQIDTSDELTCWGRNSYNQLSLSGGQYQIAGIGFGHTCAIDLTGNIRCVGLDTQNQVSGAPISGTWATLDAGEGHTCAISTTGTLQCWGLNDWGQSDVTALSANRYTSVSSGPQHNCAIRVNTNALDCWGSDAFNKATPTPGIQWSQISAGTDHTCGLDTAGLAHCFGRNTYGQASPPGGTFSRISAGEFVTCGARGNGVVECWGLGTAAGQPNAVPVGLYDWVDTGKGLQCAVTTAGTAECWGDNTYGECDAPATWW